MHSLNINNVLDRLSELRAVFVLGQRAVPFIEEVFHFLKEISPLLDEINASIRESTHKMPRATSQLLSVTQATELATTEILDLTDAVLSHLSHLRAQQEKFSVHINAIGRADTRMIRLLRAELQDQHPELLARIEVLHEEKKTLRRGLGRASLQDLKVMNEMRAKINQIMISLQVQDITAQQLAAVNHLIESIRDRMSRLVEQLGSDASVMHGPEPPTATPGTFDPNARYDPTSQNQALADEVIAAFAPGAPPPPESAGPASAEDIDQLFQQQGQDAAPEAPSEPASQDEINNLFQTQQHAAEPVSQDEIDDLFSR